MDTARTAELIELILHLFEMFGLTVNVAKSILEP